MTRHRDISFDIMKGIAILCMLIGHTTWAPGWVYRGIYSFHMPLFFIVAGYFSHSRGEKEESFTSVICKAFNRLVIPYFVVAGITITLSIIQSITNKSFEQIPHQIVKYALCLDTSFEGTLFDSYPSQIWFLLALFWSKLTFWWISKWQKFLLPISFLISFTIVLIHPYIPMPWGIAEGLQGTVMMTMGFYWKHWKEYNGKKYAFIVPIVLIALWALLLPKGKINMIFLDYWFFPMDMLAAMGGTLMVFYMAKTVSIIPLLSKALALCGKNSLYILSCHTIEMSVPIIHFILKKSHIDMISVMYYGFKHALTITGAAVYVSAKKRMVNNGL